MDSWMITIEELADLPENSYVLYDIRDDISFTYGTIPGAVSLHDIDTKAEAGTLPRDKKLILFCMHGLQSYAPCDKLRELGYDAYSLTGGYAAWLRKQMIPSDRSAEIEESLRSKKA